MKKKISVLLLIAFLFSVSLRAQVTIGALTSPAAGALLDLNRGVTGGLLLSNIPLNDLRFIPATGFVGISTQQDSNQELAGMIVYNTDATTGIGVHVWDGDDWIKPCAPPAPGPITFSGPSCAVTVGVEPVSGATSYDWTLPPGLTVVGPSDSATITISGAASTYSTGSISVRAVSSSCGAGTRRASTQDLTLLAALAAPGPITFSATTICGVGTTFTAGVTAVSGATSYDWTLPNGLTVVGPSDGATITISGDAKTYPAGSITVRAVSPSCGDGAPSTSTQDVTVVAIPATPGPITFSSTTICGAGTTFTAGVTAVSGATSYDWTLPNGLTVVGPSDGATITISGVAGTYSAGSISVRAMSSSCGSTPRTGTQTVTVGSIPAEPINPSSNSVARNSSFTFSATVPDGHVIDWYDALTGGNQTHTGVNSFSENLTASKTYYAESRNTATGCVSATRLAVTGTVVISGCDNPPATPLITSANVQFVNNNSPLYTRRGITLSTSVKIVGKGSKTSVSTSDSAIDYRDHSTSTVQYGSWFTWCMVAWYADVLCPSPWRVPSLKDFQDYSGITTTDDYTYEIYGRPADKVSEAIDGWLLSGFADGSDTYYVGSHTFYWSSTPEGMKGANSADVVSALFRAEAYNHRHSGFSLRCVR
ncbi:MAG: hypothetical protein LBP72_04685 [Dysgonamonadaceae bacterium]|jgi:uncharacterized protein (TIGR02145 family)|nr:hypothetical protein [Dysgonamonadaceae bacterium]